jgi:hypothetical protein
MSLTGSNQLCIKNGGGGGEERAISLALYNDTKVIHRERNSKNCPEIESHLT